MLKTIKVIAIAVKVGLNSEKLKLSISSPTERCIVASEKNFIRTANQLAGNPLTMENFKWIMRG